MHYMVSNGASKQASKSAMNDSCCNSQIQEPVENIRFRRVLWIALIINFVLFLVEIAGGLQSNSVSLLADAIDFLGDSVNYALSLWVLGLAAVWRSRTALLKGVAMGAFGFFVLGRMAWQWHAGVVPQAEVMGSIGLLALIANVFVAILLYKFRDGDANMKSVWLCSRNDAIGNIAVMLAALAVFGTRQAWPDLLVAVIMAALALSSATQVIKASLIELKK